jgi:glycosyltransferase involved in cell wall biosynthesis
MSVLQIGPYPPPHGGPQRNMVAIRALLARRGTPCAVINITRHRQADHDDVFFPKSAFQLIRLLLRLRHEIVHIHFGGMLTLRVLGLFLTCQVLPGRRTVLTFHSGGYPSTPRGRAAGPRSLEGLILRRFDRVIAVNSEIVAFLRRIGVARERIRLIVPHAFLAGEATTGELPEPLGTFFERHSPVLLAVAQLEPEYDLGLQIEAFSALRETSPRAGLVLIGSGRLESALRRQIASSPHGAHILLCGDVAHATTVLALARADVALRTTLYDGDAISVREALHLGTPVIATENGMRPAGVTVVPVSDLDALREAIMRVLAAPRHARAESVAPDEANIEAVLKVYEELSRTSAAEAVKGSEAPRARALESHEVPRGSA